MANIIIKRGWYEMPVELHRADGTVEQRKGGWHTDEERGQLYAAYRDQTPYNAAMGWSPETALRSLLKMEEEERTRLKS